MRGVSDTPTELALHVASSFWPSCVTALEIAANLSVVLSMYLLSVETVKVR